MRSLRPHEIVSGLTVTGALLWMVALGSGAIAQERTPDGAHDDQVVVVQLRPRTGEPREATVVLRNAAGIVGSCRTENGTCEIRGVPAGQHEVSAELDARIVTPPRQVMIPPGGKVSLIVAVP